MARARPGSAFYVGRGGDPFSVVGWGPMWARDWWAITALHKEQLPYIYSADRNIQIKSLCVFFLTYTTNREGQRREGICSENKIEGKLIIIKRVKDSGRGNFSTFRGVPTVTFL